MACSADLPLHDHVRSAGIDTEQLKRLAKAESQSRTGLEIGPWQTAETVAFRLETFDKKSFIASKRRQRLFERLSERKTGHCVGLSLLEVTTEGGSHQVIESSGLDAVDREAPLLLLDADADPDITERIAPGAKFITIQSPPIADIVQIPDLTLSNSWLLHPEEGAQRRAAIRTILEREVEKAAGGGSSSWRRNPFSPPFTGMPARCWMPAMRAPSGNRSSGRSRAGSAHGCRA